MKKTKRMSLGDTQDFLHFQMINQERKELRNHRCLVMLAKAIKKKSNQD